MFINYRISVDYFVSFCDCFLLNYEPSTGTDPVEGSQFKRKLSQKVDSATKSTEWKSAFKYIEYAEEEIWKRW